MCIRHVNKYACQHRIQQSFQGCPRAGAAAPKPRGVHFIITLPKRCPSACDKCEKSKRHLRCVATVTLAVRRVLEFMAQHPPIRRSQRLVSRPQRRWDARVVGAASSSSSSPSASRHRRARTRHARAAAGAAGPPARGNFGDLRAPHDLFLDDEERIQAWGDAEHASGSDDAWAERAAPGADIGLPLGTFLAGLDEEAMDGTFTE